MKAYLDNNIVSTIAKNDTPTETDAIKRLLDAHDEKKVELVTSEVTLQEIKASVSFSLADVSNASIAFTGMPNCPNETPRLFHVVEFLSPIGILT
jgi:hypothetical protein